MDRDLAVRGGMQLVPETLFLTANLIDRFLEMKGVTRKNLQLVRFPPSSWYEHYLVLCVYMYIKHNRSVIQMESEDLHSCVRVRTHAVVI